MNAKKKQSYPGREAAFRALAWIIFGYAIIIIVAFICEFLGYSVGKTPIVMMFLKSSGPVWPVQLAFMFLIVALAWETWRASRERNKETLSILHGIAEKSSELATMVGLFGTAASLVAILGSLADFGKIIDALAFGLGSTLIGLGQAFVLVFIIMGIEIFAPDLRPNGKAKESAVLPLVSGLRESPKGNHGHNGGSKPTQQGASQYSTPQQLKTTREDNRLETHNTNAGHNFKRSDSGSRLQHDSGKEIRDTRNQSARADSTGRYIQTTGRDSRDSHELRWKG